MTELLTDKQRRLFERRIHKTETCWIIQGSPVHGGYVQVSTINGRKKAHRLMYELHFGGFDPTLSVCHKCDNPRCVNPDHLFLGTHQDNMTDRNRKGRAGKKLNPALVAEIRSLHVFRKKGANANALAKRFGLSYATVWEIVNRKAWSHA